MNNIKILHLFPRLLSLYGEYGNVAVLEKVLRENGHDVTVTGWENGPLDLTGFDFIYVGSGTEDNLLEAVKRLAPYGDAVKASINGGQHWLATGNAMTLFGASVTRRGAESRGLGCFGYTTEINEAKRFLGDVVTRPIFGAACIGFVNTSSVYHGVEAPLLELVLNPQLGSDKSAPQDGIHSGNFYGTQLIGPVLVKNPHFLAAVIGQITGEAPILDPASNICKAYAISVAELRNRVQS